MADRSTSLIPKLATNVLNKGAGLDTPCERESLTNASREHARPLAWPKASHASRTESRRKAAKRPNPTTAWPWAFLSLKTRGSPKESALKLAPPPEGFQNWPRRSPLRGASLYLKSPAPLPKGITGIQKLARRARWGGRRQPGEVAVDTVSESWTVSCGALSIHLEPASDAYCSSTNTPLSSITSRRRYWRRRHSSDQELTAPLCSHGDLPPRGHRARSSITSARAASSALGVTPPSAICVRRPASGSRGDTRAFSVSSCGPSRRRGSGPPRRSGS